MREHIALGLGIAINIVGFVLNLRWYFRRGKK